MPSPLSYFAAAAAPALRRASLDCGGIGDGGNSWCSRCDPAAFVHYQGRRRPLKVGIFHDILGIASVRRSIRSSSGGRWGPMSEILATFAPCSPAPSGSTSPASLAPQSPPMRPRMPRSCWPDCGRSGRRRSQNRVPRPRLSLIQHPSWRQSAMGCHRCEKLPEGGARWVVPPLPGRRIAFQCEARA